MKTPNNNPQDNFASFITTQAEDYSPDDIELQLAYRQGAQEAMKWVMANIEDILKDKQGVN